MELKHVFPQHRLVCLLVVVVSVLEVEGANLESYLDKMPQFFYWVNLYMLHLLAGRLHVIGQSFQFGFEFRDLRLLVLGFLLFQA